MAFEHNAAVLTRPSEVATSLTNYSEASSEALDPYVEAQLETSFRSFWDKEYQREAFDTEKTITEKYQAALGRERKFVSSVLGGVRTMASRHDGPITLESDIDTTLTNDRWTDGKKVARPGLEIVVNVLAAELGDRLDVGFLTTIAQEHLDKELQSPTYMAPVIDKINPNFVISSRDSTLAQLVGSDELDDNTTNTECINSVKDIVDPGSIRELGLEKPSQWFNKKMPILDKLVKDNPNRAFVFVDDQLSAAVIDRQSNQIHGVYIGEDAQFFGIV